MEKLPKRRKKKDNPYTLLIENSKYYVLFKDGKFTLHKLEIAKEEMCSKVAIKLSIDRGLKNIAKKIKK